MVPRSFIGPIFISSLSLPSVSLVTALNVPKFIAQYLGMLWFDIINAMETYLTFQTQKKQRAWNTSSCFLSSSI